MAATSSKSYKMTLLAIVFYILMNISSAGARSIRTKRFVTAEELVHRRRRRYLEKVKNSIKIYYEQIRHGEAIRYRPQFAETNGRTTINDNQIRVVISEYLGENFPMNIDQTPAPPSHSMDNMIAMSMKSNLQGKVIDQELERKQVGVTNLRSVAMLNGRRVQMNPPSESEHTGRSGTVLKVYTINGRVPNTGYTRKEQKDISTIYNICRSINMEKEKEKQNFRIKCEIIPPPEVNLDSSL